MGKSEKKKGYVALLDILGFSELIKSDSLPGDFERYFEIMKGALESYGPNIQYVTFSDSILINTTEESENNLFLLIKAVSYITYRFLIELNVPIRGCISCGDFYRFEGDKGNVMIAGKPIIDAHRFEKKQDWIGVMLSPKVIEKNATLRDLCSMDKRDFIEKKTSNQGCPQIDWLLLLGFYTHIPFHQETLDLNHYKGVVVIPQKGSDLSNNDEKVTYLLRCLKEYQKKLNEMLLYASEPKSQRKYDSTIIFIQRLRQSWEG